MPHSRTVAIVATTFASGVARLSSLASQIIIGLFLTESEVGVWALCIGIMGFTAIWRNGGAATYMPSIREADFDHEAPRCFAWAICFNLATAALTLGVAVNDRALSLLAPGVSTPEQAWGLRAALLVMAARAVVAPLALVGRMRLSVKHEFTTLARLDSGVAIARVATTWITAREGGGSLALAVPFALGTVLEILGFITLGGIRLQDFRLKNLHLRTLCTVMAWPLVIAVLTSVKSETFVALVGLLLPAAAMGIFYFAFQLASQPTMLVAGPLQNVLAPMTAQSRGNRASERNAMGRVLAAAMLFAPITTMAGASLFPAAERLLWGGKWGGATTSLYFLSVASTYVTVAALLTGPLLGLQRFKATAGFEFLKVSGALGGVLLAAVAAKYLGGKPSVNIETVTVVSACISTGLLVSSLAQIIWVAHAYRLGAAETARHLLFGPALSALTAISATSLASSLTTSIGLTHDRIGAFWEFTTVLATYLVLILLAVRFTAESTLRDTLMALPRPVADPIRRLLHLT